MTILILNGPNLNKLGKREEEIYGTTSMEDCIVQLKNRFSMISLDYFQSNAEGELINRLQENNFDALVINPGAFTHYSYAIYDALRSLSIPKIEVHISNIYQREEFRKTSVTAAACNGLISGLGINGYRLAIESLLM